MNKDGARWTRVCGYFRSRLSFETRAGFLLAFRTFFTPPPANNPIQSNQQRHNRAYRTTYLYRLVHGPTPSERSKYTQDSALTVV